MFILSVLSVASFASAEVLTKRQATIDLEQFQTDVLSCLPCGTFIGAVQTCPTEGFNTCLCQNNWFLRDAPDQESATYFASRYNGCTYGGNYTHYCPECSPVNDAVEECGDDLECICSNNLTGDFDDCGTCLLSSGLYTPQYEIYESLIHNCSDIQGSVSTGNNWLSNCPSCQSSVLALDACRDNDFSCVCDEQFQSNITSCISCVNYFNATTSEDFGYLRNFCQRINGTTPSGNRTITTQTRISTTFDQSTRSVISPIPTASKSQSTDSSFLNHRPTDSSASASQSGSPSSANNVRLDGLMSAFLVGIFAIISAMLL